MTIMERIADLISGGAVSRAKQDTLDEYVVLIFALQDIADMETPSANATVRRMAQRARRALVEQEEGQ